MSDGGALLSDEFCAFEALVDALVDPAARPRRPTGRPFKVDPALAEGVPPHGFPRPARRGGGGGRRKGGGGGRRKGGGGGGGGHPSGGGRGRGRGEGKGRGPRGGGPKGGGGGGGQARRGRANKAPK